MNFRTKYSPRKPVETPHGGVSLTTLDAFQDCDISEVVRRYNAGDTSMLRKTGTFIDCSLIGDFAECMNKVKEGEKAFADLPSSIRARFGGDPVALMSFLADSSNDAEAIRLGLKREIVKEKTLEEKIVDGVTAATAATSATTSSTSEVATPKNT